MQYPKDPLSEKDVGNVVVFCVKAEPNYKSFSDKIVKSCMKDNATPLKVQKAIIDKVKEIIKAAPKKHAALEKFYCLKLLNKIILKKNAELNKHVENKIMERLTILAEFNNNKDEAKSAQGLLTRGKNIFGPDEKDQSSSANFLIILLDCIEKWALTFQFSEDGGGENKFYKAYKQLLDKGVKFPSSFKQAKKQAEDDNQSMASASTMNLEGYRNSVPSSQKNTEAQSSYDDNQSDAQSMASSASSITPEKKAIIAGLKKKMQGVKEASKKAKKLMDELDLSGLDGPSTLKQINEGIALGEVSINELMSDEIAQHISNSESLLEKMLSYQETLQNAKMILQDYFDNHQQQPGADKSNFKTNVDPGMDVQNQQINFNKEQFSTEQIQSKNQSEANHDFNFGNPQHGQPPSSDFNFGGSINQSQNDASGSGSGQGQGFNFGEQSHQQNPYDYEAHGNQEMFATQINQNNQFQDFNFGGHNQEEMIQPRGSVKSVAQNSLDEASAQFGNQSAQRDSVQPQNSLATEVLDQEEVQNSHAENDADVDKFEDCENNEDDYDENRPAAKQSKLSKSIVGSSVHNAGMLKAGSGYEEEQPQPEADEMNFDMPPPSNQNQLNDFNFGAASQAPAPNTFDEFSFSPPPDADKQAGNPENQQDQQLKKQNYGTFGTNQNQNQADVEFKFDNGQANVEKPIFNYNEETPEAPPSQSQQQVMDDFNFGQQQSNQHQENEQSMAVNKAPANDFNFGAPQPDNAAGANNDFQFGAIQNSAPKDANDFNFEALPEIGSENIDQFNFNEKPKEVGFQKEPEKEGNFDDMPAEGVGAENNPNPPPKQLMPIMEEKKEELVNSSPPKVEQAQQQQSQSILSQVGTAVGTSVFSLLSNVIAGPAAEPESPAVLNVVKRQSSVKQSPSQSQQSQDQGFQMQNDKNQLSGQRNTISIHRPSSQVQQSPNIMQKSPVADQDDEADMQSDEDFVDEGVQFKNQNLKEQQISASNRSHHKESLRIAPQVTETERQIDELKIVLKAGRVVSWWSSIHTPTDDVQVSNPFQHPLSYAQIEKTRDIKEMQNEMEELKREVMVLKREKLEHQEHQENLKHLSGKDAARVAELEFEIENHNADLQSQKQQHSNEKQSVEDQYREEVEQLRSGAELQEQLHQALKQELADEREKISCWEVQEQEFKEKIQSAVQQLTEQLSSCKEELKEKTRQVDNFDADKADLEKHVKNLQAQLEQEIAAKTDMEMDIQKLKVMFQSTTQSVANQSMASQAIDMKYFANEQGADESVNYSQAPSSAQGPISIQQMQDNIKKQEQRQSVKTMKDVPMNKLDFPGQSEVSVGNGLNVIHENELLESLQKSDFQSIPDKLNDDDVAKLQKEVANANAGGQESYRDKFQTSQTAITQMTQMSKIQSELPAQQLQQSAVKNDSAHMAGNQDSAAIVQQPVQSAPNQMPPNVKKQDSDPFASLMPAPPEPAPLPAIMPQMNQNQVPPQPQVVPSQLLGVTPQVSNQSAQQMAPPNQMIPQSAPPNQNSLQASPSISSQPEQKMQSMSNLNNQPVGRQPNFQQIPGGGSSFVEQQKRAPSPFAQSMNQQNAQRASSPFAQSMNQQMANKVSMGGLNPAGNTFAQQRQSVQVQSGTFTASLGGRPSAVSNPAQLPLDKQPSQPAQLPGPKPQPGASPVQPGGIQAPNAMAQQLQVNMQQQMLLAKLQSFHINSLLQGDKCVVYEDVNIKIGCVRQILYANGRINSLIKLFLRNHNTQNLNMNQVFLKVVNIKNPNLNNYIKISRSSQPLPLKVPQSKPLGPNQTIDLDVQLQWICDNSVQGMGLANFLMGSFNLQLFYELSNDRKSGNLPITIPLNVLNILSPMNLQTFEFKGLWDQIKSNSKYPNSVMITKQFSLDLQKAQNMAKLKQIISFGGTSFTQINDIEPNAPNVVGFATQLNKPQLVAEAIWILVRLTLTKDGNNCTFEIAGAKDGAGLTQNVANSVLSLIAKNQ